ncbi:Ferric iron reductase protein FhuF, involved in iron transport [Thermoactinomyces sp. DSM 45891]|uniref:IucA/IucC family C-terminal-domain containing protein n=1 Tax=Thermoactinomyces sp. DSM 45891 TaxID=1761907 RepID=UPI00091111AA|nr:IucA/IucC family C-terminal-domain containing protein [Thermoactinomyces sp. DSM 45891]SFX02952.1 Ferric iron reductase protein FhuF, involved in iron transport [Thermoactinomyces sp. DSM 45891]
MSMMMEELNLLQTRFRLDPRSWSELKNEVQGWSFPLSDLLEEKPREQVLRQIKDLLGTANLSVASSMLVKRISFAFLIPLALFSLYQKRVTGSTWNVSLLTPLESDSLWVPSIVMDLSEVQEVNAENRSSERTELFRWMFQQHFAPWVNGIRCSVNISEITLWENVFVYIKWMYQTMRGEASSVECKRQIEEDYQALISDPTLSLDQKGTNPFIAFSQESFTHNRKTCCLAYLTSLRPQHCKTCPVNCSARESSSN